MRPVPLRPFGPTKQIEVKSETGKATVGESNQEEVRGPQALLASATSKWTQADPAFREALRLRDDQIDEVQRLIEAVLSYYQRRKIEDALESTNRLRLDPLIVENLSLFKAGSLSPSTVPKP
jgi:hypothetical protein